MLTKLCSINVKGRGHKGDINLDEKVLNKLDVCLLMWAHVNTVINEESGFLGCDVMFGKRLRC
jgi:hypothetical protein